MLSLRVKSDLRVLVTDADYKQTLGIVRNLGQAGVQVSVAAKSHEELSSYSRYCIATHLAPGPSEPGYVDAVLGILRRHPHDLLLPVGYAATTALAQRRYELTELTKLEIADFDKIFSAADKRAVHRLALQLGVPVPNSYYPDTLNDVYDLLSQICFPVVVKPSRESAGITVRYASSGSELSGIYERYYMKSRLSEKPLPMIQEFIPGCGCGFFAVYQDGVCKRIFMHRRVRENPPAGGASCCAESYYDEKLKEHGMRILDHLQWHGVAMVEFRHDARDNQYKLLEVNPKFWGSLDLALAAGVDFPLYLCEMAEGKQLAYSDHYRKKLRYHWPLSGEAQHVLARPRSTGSVLMDTLSLHVESNIWLSDLRPNWREAVSLMRSGWRRVRSASR